MDQLDGCQEVPFNSFFGISDVLNLRESCMRENRTCSLRGGRRLACKRASSDPTKVLVGWAKCPVRSAIGGRATRQAAAKKRTSKPRKQTLPSEAMMGILGVPSLLVCGEGQCHR